MAQPVLYVLIGPPGAGKTTYAQSKFPPEWIVSADEVRERLTRWRRLNAAATWKYVAPFKAKVSRALGSALKRRLGAGLPAVYDNANLTREARESILKLVPPGVAVRYLVFDRPLEAKLRSRGWRPERLVAHQHALFQKALPAILAGDGREFVSVEDLREAR